MTLSRTASEMDLLVSVLQQSRELGEDEAATARRIFDAGVARSEAFGRLRTHEITIHTPENYEATQAIFLRVSAVAGNDAISANEIVTLDIRKAPETNIMYPNLIDYHKAGTTLRFTDFYQHESLIYRVFWICNLDVAEHDRSPQWLIRGVTGDVFVGVLERTVYDDLGLALDWAYKHLDEPGPNVPRTQEHRYFKGWLRDTWDDARDSYENGGSIKDLGERGGVVEEAIVARSGGQVVGSSLRVSETTG